MVLYMKVLYMILLLVVQQKLSLDDLKTGLGGEIVREVLRHHITVAEAARFTKILREMVLSIQICQELQKSKLVLFIVSKQIKATEKKTKQTTPQFYIFPISPR